LASTAQAKLAISKLVDRAGASGDIRMDIEPLDLLRNAKNQIARRAPLIKRRPYERLRRKTG
jgi:hypothetical protein